MQPEPKVLRRLIRRAWQILLLWLVVSFATTCVIDRFVEPIYESFSILRVDPSAPKLLEPLQQDFVDPKILAPYLRTQVTLITSGRVLKEVIADPSVVRIPVIRESHDPEADLRKKLSVQIVDDAYLIRVALELPNPEHAATIVDAVVKSYLDNNKEYQRSTKRVMTANLQGQLDVLEAEIAAKQRNLQEYGKGTVNVSKPDFTPNNDGNLMHPTFVSYAGESVQRIIDQMVETQLERSTTLNSRKPNTTKSSSG